MCVCFSTEYWSIQFGPMRQKDSTNIYKMFVMFVKLLIQFSFYAIVVF